MSAQVPIRIRTVADLGAAWRRLHGCRRWADLTLGVLLLDPGGALTHALEVVDLPEGPYDVSHPELLGLFAEFADPDGSVALLYARPGAAPWHLADRAWVRFLQAVPVPGVRRWPVHRACASVLERC